MFGLFNKKSKIKHFNQYDLEKPKNESYNPAQFDEFVKVIDSYPRIDRRKLAIRWDSLLASYSETLLGDALERTWLNRLLSQLKGSYTAFESKHFILITSQEEKHTSLFLKTIENIRLRIINTLGDILEQTYSEKFIVILFDEIQDYYQYISYYYPKEGQFAHSSGCFLNDAIPHFTLPITDMNAIESIISHELTHAMVSHLPLPLWLNEGLAVNMEVAITGYNPHRLDAQKHQKHQAFWGEKEIQQFWSGESFSRPDDGNELSYQLAQLIVRSLAEDPINFYSTVLNANHTDAGEASFKHQLGYSLSDIIENILGEGNWAPNPTNWNSASNEPVNEK